MGCFQNVEIKIADEEIPDKAGSISSRCNVKIQQNIWLFNISHKTLLIVQYWTELIRQLPIVQIAAFLMIMMIIVTSSLFQFQYFEFINCQPKDFDGRHIQTFLKDFIRIFRHFCRNNFFGQINSACLWLAIFLLGDL